MPDLFRYDIAAQGRKGFQRTMKERLKAYVVLLSLIFIIAYLASEHFAKKVDEEVEVYNQRITILHNAHKALYHMTAIQEGLYSLHYGTYESAEPIKEHFKELEEGIQNLSKGVSYIFYAGKDDDLFRTYSHHVDVIETLYPKFMEKVNNALAAKEGHEREAALKDAIENSEGLGVIFHKVERFVDDEYEKTSRSLPTITEQMRGIRNVTGILFFIAIVVSSFLMFYTCKVYKKLLPFITAIRSGRYDWEIDISSNDGCGREIASAICFMAEKMREGQAASESLTIADPLTGAYNRRYFDIRIEEEMNRCIRYGTIFSLSLIDIDHFKEINDTYGHQVGDSVLKELVGILKENSRETDILTRYGGEEFAIIYPCTPKSGVLTQVERLREVVEEHPFKDLDRPLTISIGAADSAGKNSPALVIQEADTNLYAAKRSGRNRCVIAGVNA